MREALNSNEMGKNAYTVLMGKLEGKITLRILE